MLKRFSVKGFKSLDADVELPPMTVLFGPNAAGKSNFLDALQALSRIATERTLKEAITEPIRGYPVEAFRFPAGGLAELIAKPTADFTLEADILAGDGPQTRYRVRIAIQPSSGSLRVTDEYLTNLNLKYESKGTPLIQVTDGIIKIHRKSKPGRPREEKLGQPHTILSDPRFSGDDYPDIERTREEMRTWRTYYLDPRVSMRSAQNPAEVNDVGVHGENIAPFLLRLKNEAPKQFDAVRRALQVIIPTVEGLAVDLDERRATIDIRIKQEGIEYSSRIISEGTLRVLALCAISLNPWPTSLVAFEEPENGVHPRRVERIADLLLSLATRKPKTQVVVTTHSPLFCGAVLKKGRELKGTVGLFTVRREGSLSVVRPFSPTGPLYTDSEIAKALSDRGDEAVFEGLVLRGMLDE